MPRCFPRGEAGRPLLVLPGQTDTQAGAETLLCTPPWPSIIQSPGWDIRAVIINDSPATTTPARSTPSSSKPWVTGPSRAQGPRSAGHG